MRRKKQTDMESTNAGRARIPGPNGGRRAGSGRKPYKNPADVARVLIGVKLTAAEAAFVRGQPRGWLRRIVQRERERLNSGQRRRVPPPAL